MVLCQPGGQWKDVFCKDLSWVYFFVIFVNDLPAKIDQCSVSLYADECPYRTGEKMQVVLKVHSSLHGRAPAYLCSKFSLNAI